ncbi:hypothetical protein D2T33_16965 [Sinirhodobacter populi]|uniref:Uncharacterized protein n=1 Tax=Paenirhodobacter populi TaxID=2306993 RepID=A0A443IP76_9RHOB|nr:hypothetical protein D2T33_16965 [Sinirhodobacter populi]
MGSDPPHQTQPAHIIAWSLWRRAARPAHIQTKRNRKPGAAAPGVAVDQRRARSAKARCLRTMFRRVGRNPQRR